MAEKWKDWFKICERHMSNIQDGVTSNLLTSLEEEIDIAVSKDHLSPIQVHLTFNKQQVGSISKIICNSQPIQKYTTSKSWTQNKYNVTCFSSYCLRRRQLSFELWVNFRHMVAVYLWQHSTQQHKLQKSTLAANEFLPCTMKYYQQHENWIITGRVTIMTK